MSTDAFADIMSMRGSEFLAAVVDAIEQEGYRLRAREEIAMQRGQTPIPENLRRAAFLSAAAEIVAAMRIDGENAAAAGRAPVNVIVKAVTAGKRAFVSIDQPQRHGAAA